MSDRAAAAHPLMAPLRPVSTVRARAVLWLLVVAGMLLSLAFRQFWIFAVIVGGYFVYVIYGHVVYRWLRWRYKRRLG
jgi:hypothetical protein